MCVQIDASTSQLFLDDAVIERSVRLRRVIHEPVKHFGNPVYTVQASWEGRGVIYLGGVYIDPADRLWKAWYVTLFPPEYPEIVYAVCVIYSEDGIRWFRPELDVYRGHNGERTNIVLDLGRAGGTGAPSVMYESENPDEPWVMYLSTCWPHDSGEYKGYFLRSRDGIHWRWLQERPEGIVHGCSDRMTCMRRPDAEYPYVIMGRHEAETARYGLKRVSFCRAVSPERGVQDGAYEVVVPDLEDDPAGQVYHARGFPYAGTYVGLFQWFMETDDPYGEMELVTSRDGLHWTRVPPRRPFLPRSPGGRALGAFDAQVTDTALSPPVPTRNGKLDAENPDTLSFYYWGGQSMHGNRHISWGRGIGLAQLRLDGFCSVRALRYPGTLHTRSFVWPGGRLLLSGHRPVAYHRRAHYGRREPWSSTHTSIS